MSNVGNILTMRYSPWVPRHSIRNFRKISITSGGRITLSGMIFQDDSRGRCLFTMITKVDLKGWLPSKVVDQALTFTLTNYFTCLKSRMKIVQQHLYICTRLKHQAGKTVSSQASLRSLHMTDREQSLLEMQHKKDKKKRSIFHFRKSSVHKPSVHSLDLTCTMSPPEPSPTAEKNPSPTFKYRGQALTMRQPVHPPLHMGIDSSNHPSNL